MMNRWWKDRGERWRTEKNFVFALIGWWHPWEWLRRKSENRTYTHDRPSVISLMPQLFPFPFSNCAGYLRLPITIQTLTVSQSCHWYLRIYILFCPSWFLKPKPTGLTTVAVQHLRSTHPRAANNEPLPTQIFWPSNPINIAHLFSHTHREDGPLLPTVRHLECNESKRNRFPFRFQQTMWVGTTGSSLIFTVTWTTGSEWVVS
jgi:hypothetical protein